MNTVETTSASSLLASDEERAAKMFPYSMDRLNWSQSERHEHESIVDHKRYGFVNGLRSKRTEIVRLEGEVQELRKALELIASAKDRGFGIDYARGLAESLVAKHKPE